MFKTPHVGLAVNYYAHAGAELEAAIVTRVHGSGTEDVIDLEVFHADPGCGSSRRTSVNWAGSAAVDSNPDLPGWVNLNARLG